MAPGQLIALIIFAAAIVDGLIGFFVVRPRVTDAKAKVIITYAFVASTLFLCGLAYGFWSGAMLRKQ